MRNDCKHVALEKIRDTLNLLRKSNLGSNPSQREDSLLNRLKSLQDSLRYDQTDVINPSLVVDPFLAILRAPYLAGPFKLVALDALQTFTSCRLFSEVLETCGETLAKVVDAVTRCKFVQTDATGDELVQLQIIQTLSNIIKNPVSCHLTDATAWDIITASHSILIHIAATGSVRSIVYQAAEKTIIDASRFIFASAGRRIAYETDLKVSNGDRGSQILGPSSICAVKVLNFFIEILQRCCDEGKSVSGASTSGKRPVSSPGASANGNGNGAPNGANGARHSINGFGGETLNPETRELLFAIKAINAIFLAEGDLDSSRALISNYEPLSVLVRDDLGRCLILLCSRRGLPPAVLQSALGLFSLTVQLMGATTRILVECFMRFIYIKAILQVRVIFAAHDESMRLAMETQPSEKNNTGNSLLQSQLLNINSSASFTIEELEIILESLADLLADVGFLPSLFASFDCDPSKGDIVQPLVKYLSACMRYTLVCEPAELGAHGIQEVGTLIEQCYAQISFTLNQRESSKAARAGLAEDDIVLVVPVSSPDRSDEHVDEGGNVSVPPQLMNGSNHEIKRATVDWNALAVKLRLTRLAKGVLAEAALKFSTKPSDGLKFLQKRGVLPTPLTPASVAKFLRIAPGLPNECTGSFLGELGKDNPSFEADGKAFHREVLLCYVRSFELRGQTVLNCMRIFLSAFRLPGEAQQIDRILVAFSEYCHDGSIEGNSGLLENPEVTYLLTFSMIMLNTDLHNPNVRADRKMTIAQFIKNNSFYGEELNQTRIIPKEYLETVYASLSQVPLRTERNDLNASITPEMWMDLQLQATINTEKGLLISTQYTPLMIRKMSKIKKIDSTLVVSSDESNEGDISERSIIESEVVVRACDVPNIDEIARVARHLLTENGSPDDIGMLELSESIQGIHWVVDKDLLSCVFHDFFGVAVSPFVMHQYVVAPTVATVAPRATSVSYTSHGHGEGAAEGAQTQETNHWRTRHASVRALSVGIELSLELMALLHSNEMQTAVDALILLFVDFSGVSIKDNFCYSILKSLSLIDFEVTEGASSKPGEGKLKAVGFKSNRANADGDGKDRVGDNMMEGLLTSIASRAALGTLLLITHRSPVYLSGQCWRMMWILLSLLRDCSLLPAKMIVLNADSTDSDLLPPSCRTEFEGRLLAAGRRDVDAQLRLLKRTSTAPRVKKSSSLLSLQGLGEALFGSSQEDHPAEGTPSMPLYCTVPPRWDVGYEGMDVNETERQQQTPRQIEESANGAKGNDEKSSTFSSTSTLFTVSSSTSTFALSGPTSDIVLQGEKSREGVSEYEDVRDVLAAFINLRDMMAACGVAQLVSDTRFFSEGTLRHFFLSLVAATESGDGMDCGRLSEQPSDPSVESKEKEDSAKKSSNTSNLMESSLATISATISDQLLSASSFELISASSVSWLENILVEASLRNRDRLSILWDLLSQHYEVTIKSATLLTYPLERRISALFRLSARMINRDVFTRPILELFRLFVPSGKDKRDERNASIDEDRSKVTVEGDDSESGKVSETSVVVSGVSGTSSLKSALMADLAGQVSAGMWRVLTTNLEVLPTLTLSQWQIVFDVIAVCAGAGGYSSIKAFESMAWLLHESRLQGEIPMFCIVGIRPLLCNNRTTISVSVGAIKLLTHLHSRLEVLFTNEEDYVQVDVEVSKQAAGAITVSDPDHDSDTPLLWESCWTPILSAMAEGCADSRKPVRLAASNALCTAVTDRHVRNVPVGLMVKILGDVYIAVVLRLAEFLVREKEANGGDSGWSRIDADGESESSNGPQRKMSGTAKRRKDSKEIAAVSDMKSEGDAQAKEGDEPNLTVIPMLCTICKVFVDQIRRFSSYPSFDRLWLRLIHVFGYFLGAPYGFDHAVLLPSQRVVFSDELYRTVKAAGEHLTTLIELLVKSGIFRERSGLWLVTKDSLSQMTYCPPDLLSDSPDLESSPVATEANIIP